MPELISREFTEPADPPKPKKLVEGRWDYERGLIIQVSGASGERIMMYVDEPGTYLNAQGQPVSEDVARGAGFDVTKHKADRRRQESLARARAAVDQQYKVDLERIEREGDHPPVLATQSPPEPTGSV